MMMLDSNRPPTARANTDALVPPHAVSPSGLSSAWLAASGASWVDGFDPEMPADPPQLCSQTRSDILVARDNSHKLILLGAVLGAAALALGYLGAAWFAAAGPFS